MTTRLANVHPGDVLREDFLGPLGLTAIQLAKATGLSQNQVGDILRGERGVTAATALRLEAYFGVEAQFWLNLQNAFDMEESREKLSDLLVAIPRHPRYAEINESTSDDLARELVAA